MKHIIIGGLIVTLGGLFAWTGLSGCEITGAGIGLHDVEEGGECVDSDDCKHGTCYEKRCKSAPGGGACSVLECTTDAECCSGICTDSYCADKCGDEYASCDADSDCCSGYSCHDGSCESGGSCKSNGSLCYLDEDCCSGLCKTDAEECVAVGSCGGSGDGCSYDDDCCSNVCLTSSYECL